MPGLGHVTEKEPTCNFAEEEEKGRERGRAKGGRRRKLREGEE